MTYTYSLLRKVTSVTTLVTFFVSLISPLWNILFAAWPTVWLSYSSNPTGTGTLVVTAIYSEVIVGSPLISIDQPGSIDVIEDSMIDLWTGSIFIYNYTVNADDGSSYIDGVASVSLTWAYNGSGEIADPATNSTFTITTVDTVAPVITLSGAATVNVELGSSFVDAGATWTDNVDGSGVIAGYNSGSVNTGALGTYTVSYEYTDGAGNIGTGVSRTVNVVDTTAPVVTLSGSTPVTVIVGGSFTDDGATWTDIQDGSGFIAAFNSGSIDVNSTGTYIVSYLYADGSGNIGSVDRSVNVVDAVDTVAPVITLSGAATVTISQWTPYVELWASAIDNMDGNISAFITISGSVNTAVIGSYTITYRVSDMAGNPATPISRVINIIASTPIVGITGGGGGGGGGSSSSTQSIGNTSNIIQNQLGISVLQKMLETQIQNNSEKYTNPIEWSLLVQDIENSQYKEAIITLIEKGYINNTTKFDPKRNMTRAEFIKVLSLSYGFNDMSNLIEDVEIRFNDINPDSEFGKYVRFWVYLWWINPDQKSFRPNDAITIGEALKLIHAAQWEADAYAPVSNNDILSRENGAQIIIEMISIDTV